MPNDPVPDPASDSPTAHGAGPCARHGIAPWCRRVRQRLTPERWAHVVRVAELAERIARANRFTEDELRDTVLAAVLHDAARDLEDDRLAELAPPERPEERAHPMILHGRAARALAASWGIDAPRVLGAIEGHVAGVAPDDRVGTAVYVADVSEPGRGVNADVRELALHDLRSAYATAVRRKVDHLRACGKPVHPTTLEVHDSLVPDRS